MSIFSSIDISATGLTAERLRMDVISNNIANVNTTRAADGGPFRRQQVVLASRTGQSFSIPGLDDSGSSSFQGSGVVASAIVQDMSPPKMVYDPTHPDADPLGYVRMPNVNIVKEMVDMMTATRAYEANATAIDAAKTMVQKALEIAR